MCWNHHMVYGSWPREARRREPARAPAADVRVSDAERDEVVQQLSRHTGDGRLTFEEFEERVGEVFAAKTRRELDATLRGLPRPSVRAPRRVDLADRLRPLTGLALLVLAVAALGPWVLWIAIPLMWCRITGRARHRRRYRHREIEPSPEVDRDELTLV
jgi:hypothetical protein